MCTAHFHLLNDASPFFYCLSLVNTSSYSLTSSCTSTFVPRVSSGIPYRIRNYVFTYYECSKATGHPSIAVVDITARHSSLYHSVIVDWCTWRVDLYRLHRFYLMKTYEILIFHYYSNYSNDFFLRSQFFPWEVLLYRMTYIQWVWDSFSLLRKLIRLCSVPKVVVYLEITTRTLHYRRSLLCMRVWWKVLL